MAVHGLLATTIAYWRGRFVWIFAQPTGL